MLLFATPGIPWTCPTFWSHLALSDEYQSISKIQCFFCVLLCFFVCRACDCGASAGDYCRRCFRSCPWWILILSQLLISLWSCCILHQQSQHVRWMDATSCLAAERHCGRSAVTLAWASVVPPGKSATIPVAAQSCWFGYVFFVEESVGTGRTETRRNSMNLKD